MWQEIAEKELPILAMRVLCARRGYGQWDYQVLIHWPDGVWTDTEKNEIEEELMPEFWMDLPAPPNQTWP